MKILLVYCNVMQQNALPIGVTQLTACLKQEGHDVILFDTTFYQHQKISSMEIRFQTLQYREVNLEYNHDDIFVAFKNFYSMQKPDLIAFSVVEPTYLLACKLLASIKPDIDTDGVKVAIGGTFVILATERVATDDKFDYICTGEGEISFPKLCTRLESGDNVVDQQGFWVRTKSGWQRNKPIALTDLEKNPPLDFTLFGDDYLKKPMMGKHRRTISIETARGCPYQCTYCAAPTLRAHTRHLGKYFRPKSPEKINAELKYYVEKWHPEFVYMIAESFLAMPKDYLQSLYKVYAKFKIPFWFNTRPEDITKENIQIMKDLGCMRISLGLESGNNWFRKNVLKRNTTNEQIIKAANIIKNVGISFSMNLILGMPDETMEMIFDGIKLLRKIRPDGVSSSIFTPYHGTPLREICIKKGYIKENEICNDFYQKEYSLQGNTLSANAVLGMYNTLPLYVHLPESDYPKIEIAKHDTDEGKKAFQELRIKFIEKLKWNSNNS